MVHADVAALRKALVYLEKRREEQEHGVTEYTPIDFQSFYDLLAEDVIFEVPTTTPPPEDEAGKPISTRTPPWNVIGCVHHGKDALIEAFAVDQSDMDGWEVQRPLEYLTDGGSKVAVLLSERYVKLGAQVPWSTSVMLFEFRDGEVVRYTHVADMSGHFSAVRVALQRS